MVVIRLCDKMLLSPDLWLVTGAVLLPPVASLMEDKVLENHVEFRDAGATS